MKKLPTPTQITGFSDEELEAFYNELTKEYKNYYHQKSFRDTAPTLAQVLKLAKVKNGTQIALAIRVATEERLRRLIIRIAAMQYTRMEKRNDYGELGQQRVVLSYCRLLLNVPLNREVTQSEVDAFYVKIAELQRPFDNYSADRLENLELKQKLIILGKPYELTQDKELNTQLLFLGSERRVIIGYLGNYRSIIYGKSKDEHLEGYTITRIHEEEARTPANVLSIAAVVGGKHVAIRYESCQTIFANKWRKMFQYEHNELRRIMSGDPGNIGEVFKIKALQAYKAKSLEKLDELEDKFIEEMAEGLLVHELGHGIVINDLLTPEESAFGEALAVLGCNIVSVQKEILADWAPRRGALVGPMKYFAEIAEKDPVKATRLLYVYLSDNWFLGTSTDNFANHTDIMISLLLPYMKKDSGFNFSKLNKELKAKHPMFDQVLKDHRKIIQFLEKKVRQASYTVEGQLLHFNKLLEKVKQRVRKEEPGLQEDSVEFMVPVWARVLSDLKQTNQHLFQEITAYLEEENKRMHQRICGLLQCKGADTLREVMGALLKENGFMLEVTPISIENAFQLVMVREGFSPKVRQEVLAKLALVIKHGLTVAINYQGEPDPFVTVFQMILEKGNMGALDTPMKMGTDISNDDSMSARKIAFNNEINNLTRLIRDGVFSSIKVLKINRRYAQGAWPRAFLKKMRLYDGKPFITKVGKVVFEDFKPTHIFEVFIPLRKGYWDWSTGQAITRVNKQLRPYAFDGQDRIDRFFLEAMAEEYFKTLSPIF